MRQDLLDWQGCDHIHRVLYVPPMFTRGNVSTLRYWSSGILTHGTIFPPVCWSSRTAQIRFAFFRNGFLTSFYSKLVYISHSRSLSFQSKTAAGNRLQQTQTNVPKRRSPNMTRKQINPHLKSWWFFSNKLNRARIRFIATWQRQLFVI